MNNATSLPGSIGADQLVECGQYVLVQFSKTGYAVRGPFTYLRKKTISSIYVGGIVIEVTYPLEPSHKRHSLTVPKSSDGVVMSRTRNFLFPHRDPEGYLFVAQHAFQTNDVIPPRDKKNYPGRTPPRDDDCRYTG